MIKAHNLVKIYTSKNGEQAAVDDVSLEVAEGEMLGIAGDSGSGKSTLLNLLSTLDTPNSGEIYYDDIEVTKLSDADKCKLRLEKIGFVFQSFNLEPNLSVLSNITLAPMILGIDKKTRENRAMELLEKLGIQDKAKARASELSGGEMQRVAFIRAIINNPKVVFADEPTGNLDSKNSINIIEMLQGIKKENVAVVLVSHNMNDIKKCDRVLYIKDGKLVGGDYESE